MRDALQIFLLAFPALFSIVNPLGGGFMFLNITRRLSHDDREWLARWIAIYSLILLNASIYIGAYVLSFLGISLPALRIAGGLVIALMAWLLPKAWRAARRIVTRLSGFLSGHAREHGDARR